MIIEPFCTGNGHADAAVGRRFTELVVFHRGYIVDCSAFSRHAVEENMGVAEACAVLGECGCAESMPAVLVCGAEGSQWGWSFALSRRTDKGPVRNNIPIVTVRGIDRHLTAGAVDNDLEGRGR